MSESRDHFTAHRHRRYVRPHLQVGAVAQASSKHRPTDRPTPRSRRKSSVGRLVDQASQRASTICAGEPLRFVSFRRAKREASLPLEHRNNDTIREATNNKGP